MAKTAKGKSRPEIESTQTSETISTSAAEPTEEEIAVRAYHIYLERGEADGDPMNDWLQAERELKETRE